MHDLIAMFVGALVGALAILGVWWKSRDGQPAQDVPPLTPPKPTTHMGEPADLDSKIDPPAPTIEDHVKWADEARGENDEPETRDP